MEKTWKDSLQELSAEWTQNKQVEAQTFDKLAYRGSLHFARGLDESKLLNDVLDAIADDTSAVPCIPS